MATKAEIEKYVEEIREAKKQDWQLHGYNMEKVPTFDVEYGSKFAKISITTYGSKSVHCFVEISTGDIYKAATWKAPAKGVRGNICDEKKPLLCGDYYIRR